MMMLLVWVPLASTFIAILVNMIFRGLNVGHRMLERVSPLAKVASCLLWHTMHLTVSMWYFTVGLVSAVESFLIGRGLLKRYRGLDVSKVKYLAVVIDSEEAIQTLKVLDILRWLAKIGVKNVCLYDEKGMLKKGKDVFEMWLESEGLSNGYANDTINEQKIHLEFVSFCDGKLAIAKAANHLTKLYSDAHTENRKLTEPDLTDALKEIGYLEPDPDLMLVYGPARCNMGFPPWRIRYTEIVHMGPLKSMKFGGLIKAIHRFTSVRQNYGK